MFYHITPINLYVLLFNSWFYCLTRTFNLVTLAFNLPTRAFNLTTCTFTLLTRGFELVTGRLELVTHGFEVSTLKFELVSHISELVTRVLIFHDYLLSNILNYQSSISHVRTALLKTRPW